MADAFELDYTEGILDEEPETPGDRRSLERAVPAEAFALRGCVLTPDRAIEDGWVLIDGDRIDAVRDTPPDSSVRVLETGGVVLPGLIDLHGHPEYNVFAPWEPPKLYKNRYAWRDSKEYAQVVKEPWAALADKRDLLARYAEARALVGGVTAIQGASAKYAKKEEALVRNVDLRIFGQHKARSIIDLSRTTPADASHLRSQIDAGDVTAVYVHLAEGVDDRSRKELDELIALDLLTPATVIIHGTALDDAQLGHVADAGAKLVWSPQSNFRLYADTTRAAKARALGIPLGLGADWLPSGSPSTLGELKVARRTLARQGAAVPARDLVRMITCDAADIAGLGDHLGRLDGGRPADVLVLERQQQDPWENVAAAMPAWVELVVLGGSLVYGREDWITELTGPGQPERALAWGKPVAVDTSYSVATTPAPPPRLADLRAQLLDRFPRAGPIFV